MAEEPIVSLQSDGLQPGHDIFCTPNNDAFNASSLYSELDVAQQEIRLVRLWPGTEDDVIECTLLPGAPLLDLKGRYTAPSYCAGSAKNTEPIVLNGAPFNVFANLAHALREVRHFWQITHVDRKCLLWIDQISINQYDINERSHQVQFMREIYQNAEQVLVCLSTEKLNPKGMNWLIGLARDVRPRGIDDLPEAIASDDNTERVDIVNNDHRHRIFQHIRKNSKDEDFMEGWVASYNIIEVPWFTRAWVFQEFIVAANVHFMYSGVHASWQILLPVWRTISSYHGLLMRFLEEPKGLTLDLPEQRDLRRAIARIQQHESSRALVGLAFMMKTKTHWCENHDFLELLAYSRSRNTSDPRDKVYAYIGLASQAYGIVPNYSDSVDRVLIDTSIKIIETEDSLEILWHAAISELRHDSTLPSWVVDWRSREIFSNPVIQHYPQLRKSAANASFHSFEAHRGISLALQVEGVMMDMLDADSHNSARMGCFYTSVNGFPGACSRESQQNDEVWVLRGCRSPLILRSQERLGYKLVSAASYGHHPTKDYRESLETMIKHEKEQQGGWRTISLI